VIKTRLQIHGLNHIATPDSQPLLNQQQLPTRPSTLSIARNAYQNEGAAVFFRGIGICSARAFVVNAVQWAVSTPDRAHSVTTLTHVCVQVYEWMMKSLTSAPTPLNT